MTNRSQIEKAMPGTLIIDGFPVMITAFMRALTHLGKGWHSEISTLFFASLILLLPKPWVVWCYGKRLYLILGLPF